MTKRAATRMAEGLPAAWEAAIHAMDGGVIHRVDGLVVTLTELPDPQLNTCFVERAPESPADALAAAAAVFAEHDQRLGIDLPRGWYPDLERAATDLGLKLAISRPGMTAAVSSLEPAIPPDGVELLLISGRRDLEEFWRIQGAGFGMDPDVVRAFNGPGLLAAGNAEFVLARSHGVAVACALRIILDGAVGIFGVATLPEARRRGIGTAVTAAAIDSARGEADLAWLQASEDGERVYGRMGFLPVAEWDVRVLP